MAMIKVKVIQLGFGAGEIRVVEVGECVKDLPINDYLETVFKLG